MFARIDKVDCNAIKACAKRFFYDRDFAMASLGNISVMSENYNPCSNRTGSRAPRLWPLPPPHILGQILSVRFPGGENYNYLFKLIYSTCKFKVEFRVILNL
jgi:hypothetical protein